MAGILTVLIIIVCILLGLIVLIQNPKGGGLDSAFGSAAQLGGVKKTTDFLEKSTWTLAIALVVLSLSTAAVTKNNPNEVVEDNRYRDAPAQTPPAGQPAPSQPAN